MGDAACGDLCLVCVGRVLWVDRGPGTGIVAASCQRPVHCLDCGAQHVVGGGTERCPFCLCTFIVRLSCGLVHQLAPALVFHSGQPVHWHCQSEHRHAQCWGWCSASCHVCLCFCSSRCGVRGERRTSARARARAKR